MVKKEPPSKGPIGLAGTEASGAQKWDVCKIWTRKLGKPFTPVSSYFLENYHRLPFPISANELALIIHLLKHKWDDAMPYPAIATLAKRMLRSEQAVRAVARSLEKSGYLKRHMTRGRTNHFDLRPLFQAVEKLYDEDVAKAAAKEAAPAKRWTRRTG